MENNHRSTGDRCASGKNPPLHLRLEDILEDIKHYSAIEEYIPRTTKNTKVLLQNSRTLRNSFYASSTTALRQDMYSSDGSRLSTRWYTKNPEILKFIGFESFTCMKRISICWWEWNGKNSYYKATNNNGWTKSNMGHGQDVKHHLLCSSTKKWG